MLSFFSAFFDNKKIELWGALPLCKCRLLRPYLLERAQIQTGSVIMLALPYFTPACDDPKRNLSAYAVGPDYHNAFRELFDELLPLLQGAFPENKFAAFADHSPIDEIEAAARAGLGVIGQNKMLLTQKYSSYLFLGEIITDAELSVLSQDPKNCFGCGACMRACPASKAGVCLSALTQKKGLLTEDEQAVILQYKSVWGCDICQSVCPYTARARENGTLYTPLEFFYRQPIPYLDKCILSNMSNEEFASRAYAWRGRETVLRNLGIAEKGEESC